MLQGVTELFPISSLGHSVLLPAWLGGDWAHLVTESSTATSEASPYLAFIVALHVATAVALLVFYRADWVRIIGAFFRTLRTRRVETSTERLAWLIVIATVPVGLTGLLAEHTFRTLFAKPLAAAVFLFVNGLILLGGERLRRRAEPVAGAPEGSEAGGRHAGAAPTRRGLVVAERRRLATLSWREGFLIGAFQTMALFAGISRSGITMVAGLLRGLDHEEAVGSAMGGVLPPGLSRLAFWKVQGRIAARRRRTAAGLVPFWGDPSRGGGGPGDGETA